MSDTPTIGHNQPPEETEALSTEDTILYDTQQMISELLFRRGALAREDYGADRDLKAKFADITDQQ